MSESFEKRSTDHARDWKVIFKPVKHEILAAVVKQLQDRPILATPKMHENVSALFTSLIPCTQLQWCACTYVVRKILFGSHHHRPKQQDCAAFSLLPFDDFFIYFAHVHTSHAHTYTHAHARNAHAYIHARNARTKRSRTHTHTHTHTRTLARNARKHTHAHAMIQHKLSSPVARCSRHTPCQLA